MKKLVPALLLALLMGSTGLAAFTPPPPEKIRSATEDPSKLPDLLGDAKPEQAAQILAATLQEAGKLSLADYKRKERGGLMPGNASVAMQVGTPSPQTSGDELAIVDKISGADQTLLLNEQHKECIALLTGHAFVKMQRDAQALIKALSPMIGKDDWPVVVAAAAVVSSKGTLGANTEAQGVGTSASAEATPQAGAGAVLVAFDNYAPNDDLRDIARKAGQNPTAVLGKSLVAKLQELVPLPPKQGRLSTAMPLAPVVDIVKETTPASTPSSSPAASSPPAIPTTYENQGGSAQ